LSLGIRDGKQERIKNMTAIGIVIIAVGVILLKSVIPLDRTMSFGSNLLLGCVGIVIIIIGCGLMIGGN